MSLVTVGIPTYNRPGGLKRTLELVTAQSFRDITILVSDNCSPQEAEIRAIIAEFQAKDGRIIYHRQKENVGSVRNFKFLLDQAETPLFLWAADDDELELDYIEKLVTALSSHPECVTAITGFDVLDMMQEPHIKTEFTRYLLELPAPTVFQRLRRYIMQPEYYGKMRIAWGLHRTSEVRQALEASLQRKREADPLIWAFVPFEMEMLTRGGLVVVPENLFHVFLHPTSVGKAEGALFERREVAMNRLSYHYYWKLIKGVSSLSGTEKKWLWLMLKYQEYHAFMRVVPYYFIQARFPGLARWIKKVWFRVLVARS